MSCPSIASEVPAAIRAAAEWPAGRRVQEADRCADIIASGADILRAGAAAAARADVTPGQVREAVVTGLGILACRRRGAGFDGMHWHADPARCAACPGPGTLPLFDTPAPGPAAGAVFTPRSLADDVVAPALGVITQPVPMCPAADIQALRVADPFCGTGAFLVAAARYLGNALAAAWDHNDKAEIRNLCTLYGTSDPVMAARALVIAHCLYGVDVDPASVELAGLALQLLAPECSTDHVLIVDGGDYIRHVASEPADGRVEQHARLVRPPGPPTARLAGLRTGDALVGRLRDPAPRSYPAVAARLDWPEAFPDVFRYQGGFDAVIGNPPFLGGNMIVGACGRAYREYLITAMAGGKRTIADLAVYCWIRAHQLVHGNGVTGIIGPDSLLRGGNAELALGLLGQHGWRPYRAARQLRWPSRSAAISVCTVWTHRWGGADPPDELRNVPEQPPGHLWETQFWQTVEIGGTPVGLYRHTPVLPSDSGGTQVGQVTTGPVTPRPPRRPLPEGLGSGPRRLMRPAVGQAAEDTLTGSVR
jgi:hypothetical protein